jgi:hypothetical protein
MRALAPSARAARLAALALFAGAAAGLAATGDIKASYREGRIASPWSAPYDTAPAAPLQPAADSLDPDLAHAHGFALAAQRKVTRPAECRSVSVEFRPGCEDYVQGRAGRGAGAAALDLPG